MRDFTTGVNPFGALKLTYSNCAILLSTNR
jgi:hypothetical protein